MEPERAREGQGRGEKGPESLVLLTAEAVLPTDLILSLLLQLPCPPFRGQKQPVQDAGGRDELVHRGAAPGSDPAGPSSTPAPTSMIGRDAHLALGAP